MSYNLDGVRFAHWDGGGADGHGNDFGRYRLTFYERLFWKSQYSQYLPLVFLPLINFEIKLSE